MVHIANPKLNHATNTNFVILSDSTFEEIPPIIAATAKEGSIFGLVFGLEG